MDSELYLLYVGDGNQGTYYDAQIQCNTMDEACKYARTYWKAAYRDEIEEDGDEEHSTLFTISEEGDYAEAVVDVYLVKDPFNLPRYAAGKDLEILFNWIGIHQSSELAQAYQNRHNDPDTWARLSNPK